MIEMSSRDLERYYSDSWLGLRQENEIVPVLVQGVDGSDLITSEGRINYRDPDLVYEYPDLGNVRSGNKVWFCTRVPDRQWIKGVRSSHLRVTELGEGRERRLSECSVAFHRRLLSALYNNERAGVSRYVAKVRGNWYYKGVQVQDIGSLVGTDLEYIYRYAERQQLEDVC